MCIFYPNFFQKTIRSDVNKNLRQIEWSLSVSAPTIKKNEKETSQMKKMILIAALTLVLTAAAVPGVAASFAENAGVSVCFFLGDLHECY